MANTSGVLSQWIKLSYSSSSTGTFTALNDLQSIPDLGSTPEQIDVTCMQDTAKRYMQGIKDFGSLEFGFLYDATQFEALDDLAGDTVYFKLEISDGYGETASTTFSFSGEPAVRLNGAGVNEALKYTLAIALNSDIDIA